MTRFCHVAIVKSLDVETIDVFHALEFYSVCSARIKCSGSVDVYSLEVSEHGTVDRSMNAPSITSVGVELEAAAQNGDDDAGE